MPSFAEVDRLKAELDALRPLTPEQEARVLQKFRLEWNYNSNAIEGNSLTLGETRSLLLHGLTAAGKPIRDHLDIKGHNAAVFALEDFVRDQYPLTEQFIREMHQLLLGEPYHTPAQTAGGQPTRKLIVPGRYKTSPNNVLTATGEMFYFASPEETPGRMTDLIDWYRAEEAAPTMHPVALAAEFHYRFVRIHPFDDGNGRMSRLLMNLILLRHGYPMTVIQAADRNRYLAALAEADAGEPEPFLRFIIENVEAGLRLMIRAARGESIDEPSDLDKKLALLKKQILTREDTIKTLWNDEVQDDIYDSLISVWIDDIDRQSQNFDELFLSNGYIGAIYSVVARTELIENPVNAEEFKKKMKNTISALNADIETISFLKKWFHFRQKNNGFDVGLLVTFNFSLESFKVTTGVLTDFTTQSSKRYWMEDVFNSIYIPNYDPSRIHEINYQLVNKVYDFIAAKLTEADTPPV
ncbi:Fic family protein [Hymenobacter bucti]|uniref:Fic family protein n=1 Tax=Hymenobacter bucti TaxID=1844114 RepID=A0ABW4QSB2_9BACT